MDAESLTAALAEVHVELVLIHPFREGNGRVSRLVATLMALQAGYPLLDFSPVTGAARERYFSAVQAGLDRNYVPMKTLFAEIISATERG
jgi:cell filamentation protein